VLIVNGLTDTQAGIHAGKGAANAEHLPQGWRKNTPPVLAGLILNRLRVQPG